MFLYLKKKHSPIQAMNCVKDVATVVNNAVSYIRKKGREGRNTFND